MPPSEITFSGPIYTWCINENTREYGVITIPYRTFREYFEARPYDAFSGKGEQRTIIEAHARKIQRSFKEGDYTPTTFAAGLSASNRKRCETTETEWKLTVTTSSPLPLLDGNHRGHALELIYLELDKALEKATTEADKKPIQDAIEEVLNCPVTVMIHMQGDLQSDFQNLQLGRTVDSAHLFAMKMQKSKPGPHEAQAFKTARLLMQTEGSYLKGHIKFDSKLQSGNLIPVSTLCAKAGSDLSTSLVGLARVALTAGKDADWCYGLLMSIYRTIKDDPMARRAFELGKWLTTLDEGGKKGQATMLTGVAVCMAFRLNMLGKDKPDEEDLKVLRNTVLLEMDEHAKGLSANDKRIKMREFASEFFKGMECEKHEGVPVELIKLLTHSCFSVTPLPKPPKVKKATTGKRGRPKKNPEASGVSEASAELPESSTDPVSHEVNLEAQVEFPVETSEDTEGLA